CTAYVAVVISSRLREIPVFANRTRLPKIPAGNAKIRVSIICARVYLLFLQDLLFYYQTAT
ncbi:hypothetical protein O5962_28720, partial [Escherichia coli]|nr:hypothetical protein [Escherichia coli]